MNFADYKKTTEPMTPTERSFYDLLLAIDVKLQKILSVGEDE